MDRAEKIITSADQKISDARLLEEGRQYDRALSLLLQLQSQMSEASRLIDSDQIELVFQCEEKSMEISQTIQRLRFVVPSKSGPIPSSEGTSDQSLADQSQSTPSHATQYPPPTEQPPAHYPPPIEPPPAHYPPPIPSMVGGPDPIYPPTFHPPMGSTVMAVPTTYNPPGFPPPINVAQSEAVACGQAHEEQPRYTQQQQQQQQQCNLEIKQYSAADANALAGLRRQIYSIQDRSRGVLLDGKEDGEWLKKLKVRDSTLETSHLGAEEKPYTVYHFSVKSTLVLNGRPIGHVEWNVIRRYSELVPLRDRLAEMKINVDAFPSKTFFFSSPNDSAVVKERMKSFKNFFKDLIKAKLRSSVHRIIISYLLDYSQKTAISSFCGHIN